MRKLVASLNDIVGQGGEDWKESVGGVKETLQKANRSLENLDQIIDGIVDQSYNGHRPYRTDDGSNPQPAGGDFYQLNFDRELTFTRLVFHEGDIRWNGINSDPRQDEPRGGYFLNLTVEVGDAFELPAGAGTRQFVIVTAPK